MDIERVEEIVASPTMIDVMCNEISVYIKHVDRANEMITIYPLDQPHNPRQVHVTSLREQ